MNDVDNYLAAVDPAQRVEMERIRRIVKELVPEAEETIGYGIPTFKYQGKNLIHFAGFEKHMSLFPGAAPVAEFRDRLKGYTLSKGTIQFTLEKPLPDPLLKDIVMLCRRRIDATST